MNSATKYQEQDQLCKKHFYKRCLAALIYLIFFSLKTYAQEVDKIERLDAKPNQRSQCTI